MGTSSGKNAGSCKIIIAPILIGLLFIIMSLVGLDRSPVVQIDEPTLNDPAKELVFNGVFCSSVFAGQSGFETAYFWQPPGQALVMAAVYKLLGFGIWQTRLPGVIFGGIAVMLLYFLAMRLFNSRRAATIAALLFAFEPMYIQASRMSRMDTQCLVFVLLGILFFLRANTGDNKRYVWITLSGFLVGLAGITHPLAICWAIAIGLLIILIGPRNKLPSLICFLVAAAIPPAIWFGYAFQAPELFKAQFLHHSDWHIEKGSIFARISSEPVRYFEAYKKLPLLLIAYICGLVWVFAAAGISRKTKIIITVLFAVPFLFNAIFMIKLIVGYYYLHPGLILLVSTGAFIASIWPSPVRIPRNIGQWGITVLIILLICNILAVGIIGRYVVLAYQWDARDYRYVDAGISENIPPGSIVWGPPQVWYATERVGATLLLWGEPDPGKHDYAITLVTRPVDLPDGFTKIAEFGKPLPAVLGGLDIACTGYQMQLWRSELRRTLD